VLKSKVYDVTVVKKLCALMSDNLYIFTRQSSVNLIFHL